MNRKKIWMLAAGLICNAAIGESQSIVTSVRQPLYDIVECCGRSRLRSFLLLNEWDDLNIATNSAFARLSQFVTNHWDEVLAAMPEISTNQSERLVVMASGVVSGEDRYLACISSVADMVLSNKLTSAELLFYKTRCGIADHRTTSSLVRRYQDPAISNLIMKIYAAGGYPQGVSDIFSGDANEFYLDAVHDGLIGP